MKKISKKIILMMAFIAALSAPKQLMSVAQAEVVTEFDGNVNIKAFVESTRKDYFDTVYSYDNPVPKYEKRQYDKSFYGTDSDLNFAFRTDLSDVCFWDLKESLYVRHYNEEEPGSLDYSSNKHNEIDHNLNITFGLAAGIYDYIQLDYINNITDGGMFDSLNYNSNKVKALFSHDFNSRTCMAFTGSYEERKYDTDKVLNYKEARFGFEVSSLLPGRDEYIQIANSSRGEKATFEKISGAMAAKNVIDYYTDYVRNPRDNDPTAKYICKQERGDLYIRAFGELAQRDRTELKNDCDEIVCGFETIYKTTDDMRFRLNEIYSNQDYKRESNINFLHDGYANYVALTVDYDCTKNFSQSLTYSNEYHKYKRTADEDNKVNAVTYESFYNGKNYRTSVVLGASKKEPSSVAEMAPKETEKRAAFCCDYELVKSLTFKLKAEYADLDYHDYEDDIFSNYKRKTWRVALEKELGNYCSFEIAFQNNKEDHECYNQNDVEEKTVGVSLIGKF